MTRLSDRTIFSLFFALSLVIRLIYYLEFQAGLEFLQPTVDSLYHHLAAKAIAGGALTASEPFFRAPFYDYFLASIYFLTENSIAAARLIQLVLGAFVPPLTFLIARRLFDRQISLIAGLLILLCSDLVYFQGELLLESLIVLLLLLVIYLYLKAQPNHDIYLYLSGFATGIAIVTRPNSAIVAVVILYLIYHEVKRRRWHHLLRRGSIYAVILILPVLLAVLHNVTREQGALTIATQGGINFFIGNNAEADGISAVMPGKLGFNWQYDDIKYAAEQESGHSLTAAEISDFYYQQGVRDIIDNPLGAVHLLLKKWYLFFSGVNISNNKDLTLTQAQFVTLRLLPVGMWLLAALGMIGMILSRRKSRKIKGLVFLIVLYSLSFALFFVNSRFRLPILPLLSIFSGHAILTIWHLARAAKWKPVVIIGAYAVILILIFNLNIYHLESSNREQWLFNRANLYLRIGDYPQAIKHYRESAEINGMLRQLNLNLGIAYLRTDQPDSARKYFQREDSLWSGSAEAQNNIAYMLRQQSDYKGAVAAARNALEIKPYLEEARLNLWNAQRESGFPDSAFMGIVEYQKKNELSPKEQFLFGVLALDLGIPRQAVVIFADLLAELDQPKRPDYASLSLQFAANEAADPVSRSRLLYNLGTAMGTSGWTDSAVVYLKESLRHDPGLAEGWINLGSAQMSSGNYLEARDAFLRAESLGFRDALLMHNVALTYLAEDDTNRTLFFLSRALELDSNLAPSRNLLEIVGPK